VSEEQIPGQQVIGDQTPEDSAAEATVEHPPQASDYTQTDEV
jgi:hypothetical protein